MHSHTLPMLSAISPEGTDDHFLLYIPLSRLLVLHDIAPRYKISTKSSSLPTLRILHADFYGYYSSNITNARQEVNFDNKHEIMCKAIYTWLQKTNRQEFSTLAGFSTIVNTIITKFYLPANSAFNFSVKAGTILFRSPTIP